MRASLERDAKRKAKEAPAAAPAAAPKAKRPRARAPKAAVSGPALSTDENHNPSPASPPTAKGLFGWYHLGQLVDMVKERKIDMDGVCGAGSGLAALSSRSGQLVLAVSTS